MEDIHLYDLLSKFEDKSEIIKHLNINKDKLNTIINENKYLYNFYFDDIDINKIVKIIEYFNEGNKYTKKQIKKTILDLLSEKNFYGTYMELMTYYWINDKEIPFEPQIKMSKADVLNKSGCELDGKFGYKESKDIFFDIKSFGLQEYLKYEFKRKIQKEFDDYIVMINSDIDCSFKDIERFAMEKVSNHIEILKSKISKGDNSNIYLHKIKGINWQIRLEEKKNGTYFEHNSFHSYRWAEENKMFFLKNVSQYTRNKPFILICSMTKKFNNMFLNLENESIWVAFRSIARRAFFEFRKESFLEDNDNINIDKVRKKIEDNLSICEISEYLSAILFIDLSNDAGKMYVNPFAKNKIYKHDLNNWLSNWRQAYQIDDFEYDNY